MAKFQAYKRIVKNDYPQQYQDLVDKLATTLNNTIEDLCNAFSNQITRADNMLATEIDLKVVVDSNGIPKTPISIALGNIKYKALGISVEKADNLTNPTVYPTGAPFLSWSQSNNNIQINHIAGLPAGSTWQLHVIVNG